MTMVEIKCGAYSTVCVALLNFRNLIWFNISAKMMGIGKLHNRLNRLSSIVFFIMRPKVGAVKKRENHSSPTHSLPMNPLLAL